MKTFVTFIAFVTSLSACGASQTSPSVDPSASAVSWTRDYPLEALPNESVQGGQCGLALLAKANPDNRIFFATNTPPQAKLNLEGKTITLRRVDAAGPFSRGFFERQRYETDAFEVTADINIEARSDLVNNAVVRNGVLSLRNREDGRSLIVPVVGIIGCS